MSLKDYAIPDKYLSYDLAKATKYKGIKNAYDRDELSIIQRGSTWWMESCPDKVFNCVKREMKRLYPTLTYLYDIPVNQSIHY